MTISRITQAILDSSDLEQEAIRALEVAISSISVGAGDIIEPPDTISLGMTTQEIVAADNDATRLVVMANTGPQDAFLSFNFDAVGGAGILLRVDGDRNIPLGPGVSLNGITSSASADCPFLVFGKAT